MGVLEKVGRSLDRAGERLSGGGWAHAAEAAITRNGRDLAGPIEIAPGRGDLRYSSQPFDPAEFSLSLLNGRVVSFASLFATQPAVATAVMRLLTWAARVPLKAYRRVDESNRQRLRPDEHPLARALVEPWDGGAQLQLVGAAVGPLSVHGNGLLRVASGARESIAFEPLDWRRAKPIMPGQDTIAGWEYTRDGQRDTLGADNVLHFRWWSPDGQTGVSPLAQLGVTLRLEAEAQEYLQSYLRQGARPPSGLQLPEGLNLDPDERAELRRDMLAVFGGSANAGIPPVLPHGMEWVSINAHSAHEAELVEQRKLNREEVAMVYLIPPPMMGILDKATYSNIETQRQMAYTDALGPPLVLIEQFINAQLVRNLLREDDIYVEFDFGPVLRGDRLKEIQALRQGIAGGLYTPNEARGVLNLPPEEHPDADKLWMPINNSAPIGSNDNEGA
jgi:HK97 family phage portal protein